MKSKLGFTAGILFAVAAIMALLWSSILDAIFIIAASVLCFIYAANNQKYFPIIAGFLLLGGEALTLLLGFANRRYMYYYSTYYPVTPHTYSRFSFIIFISTLLSMCAILALALIISHQYNTNPQKTMRRMRACRLHFLPAIIGAAACICYFFTFLNFVEFSSGETYYGYSTNEIVWLLLMVTLLFKLAGGMCLTMQGRYFVATGAADSYATGTSANYTHQNSEQHYYHSQSGTFHENVNAQAAPHHSQEQFVPIEDGIIYDLKGVRGRHMKVFEDKVLLRTKAGIASLMTGNATDGEKSIYYADVIGVQFKPSGLAIGYLQLETASSSGNNKSDNFFNENSFTFDQGTVSNDYMEQVVAYIRGRVEEYKKNRGSATVITQATSAADELKKFKELLDLGVITQEEFDSKKAELLRR